MRRPAKNSNGSTLVIGVIGVALLVLIIGVAFLMVSKNDSSSTTSTDQSKSTTDKSDSDSKSTLSDSRAKQELNVVHRELETYYNENGFYPSSLSTNSLSQLQEVDIMDEFDQKYSYETEDCTNNECLRYTLSYKYKQANKAEDTDDDGLILIKSLN